MCFSRKTPPPQDSWGSVKPHRRQRHFWGGRRRAPCQSGDALAAEHGKALGCWGAGLLLCLSQPLQQSCPCLPAGYSLFTSLCYPQPWGHSLLSLLWHPHRWAGRNDLALMKQHLSADSAFPAECCMYWFIRSALVVRTQMGFFCLPFMAERPFILYLF